MCVIRKRAHSLFPCRMETTFSSPTSSRWPISWPQKWKSTIAMSCSYQGSTCNCPREWSSKRTQSWSQSLTSTYDSLCRQERQGQARLILPDSFYSYSRLTFLDEVPFINSSANQNSEDSAARHFMFHSIPKSSFSLQLRRILNAWTPTQLNDAAGSCGDEPTVVISLNNVSAPFALLLLGVIGSAICWIYERTQWNANTVILQLSLPFKYRQGALD